MPNGTKIFTCDKFLGLNEAADGTTELKMGEASRMVNFAVTDPLNITLRPGIRRVDFGGERDDKTILAAWSGFIGDDEYFAMCDFDGEKDRLWLYTRTEDGDFSVVKRQDGALSLNYATMGVPVEEQFLPEEAYSVNLRKKAMVKFFTFAGKFFVMAETGTMVYDGDGFTAAEYYVPLAVTGSSPNGGGTKLESINMLSPLRRIDYSADGTAKGYILPSEAVGVTSVTVDNVQKDPSEYGSFDPSAHSFTFSEAPVKGVGNVEITYSTAQEDTEKNRLRLAAMTLVETYNGSTDTRLFMAGDGTNICYYSGAPMSGDLTKLYFPAMNEVAVDMSDSPVTGMVRHYGKLLVFKPDGCYSISYEPVTLPGGETIAGFYLRNINKDFGNDTPGQVEIVNNYPRTVSHGGVYEWRITSSYYKDERYAKRVSDAVQRTISMADVTNAVACDDNVQKTYYLFLNDDDGTVLVNRYAVTGDGVWCLYRSPLCRRVRYAAMCSGRMVFCGDTGAFWFSKGTLYDDAPKPGGEKTPIPAVWESGFLSFGADYLRKYSSQIYVSIHPAGRQQLTVTASTDRREEYMEKEISINRFSWPTVTFPTWTFDIRSTPKINRVRLKVKKFVYYKLIFKIDKPGATATVLGYDQQVRFSSMAK